MPSGGPLDETLKASLAGDAFIQSEHPRVKGLAGKIVGDEKDPWRQAKRIYDWVHENIRKTVVLSVPSALETLETREGDCNEHAVLFAALARASGIPTRVAIGLAWSDELDGFYYHAWPEVHAGRWIPMDPTLGQPIADATHVKLLNGNIETWPQLLPYIGQLRMDIVSIE
ncbi:MAG TPA: transglutaminase-like domain-containing protein [Candidatus Hydrogenedentes bacterium]|nr:transglutaminase-like domain-containing protein [Candidatus Hydrogenedentota bacterium]